jgi:hypothetical protein
MRRRAVPRARDSAPEDFLLTARKARQNIGAALLRSVDVLDAEARGKEQGMRTRRLLLTLVLGASVMLVAGSAQGPSKTLTAMDYLEIQQLVAKYAFALDTHADNGYMYADLFAPDGTFGTTKGREALAAVARNNQPEKSGPAATRHFITNVIITPTADGAVGRQYMVLIEVGNPSKPSAIEHGGFYDDIYVKTPAGWRFKSRTYTRSKLGPIPNPLPPSQ